MSISWTPQLDTRLMALVRKHLFDFERVSIAIKDECRNDPNLASAPFTADVCRVHYAFLDFKDWQAKSEMERKLSASRTSPRPASLTKRSPGTPQSPLASTISASDSTLTPLAAARDDAVVTVKKGEDDENDDDKRKENKPDEQDGYSSKEKEKLQEEEQRKDEKVVQKKATEESDVHAADILMKELSRSFPDPVERTWKTPSLFDEDDVQRNVANYEQARSIDKQDQSKKQSSTAARYPSSRMISVDSDDEDGDEEEEDNAAMHARMRQEIKGKAVERKSQGATASLPELSSAPLSSTSGGRSEGQRVHSLPSEMQYRSSRLTMDDSDDDSEEEDQEEKLPEGWVPAQILEELASLTKASERDQETGQLFQGEVGDIVQVLNRHHSGWVYIRHTAARVYPEGWVPDVNLKPHGSRDSAQCHGYILKVKKARTIFESLQKILETARQADASVQYLIKADPELFLGVEDKMMAQLGAVIESLSEDLRGVCEALYSSQGHVKKARVDW